MKAGRSHRAASSRPPTSLVSALRRAGRSELGGGGEGRRSPRTGGGSTVLDMAATIPVEPWESLNRAAEVPVGQPSRAPEPGGRAGRPSTVGRTRSGRARSVAPETFMSANPMLGLTFADMNGSKSIKPGARLNAVDARTAGAARQAGV